MKHKIRVDLPDGTCWPNPFAEYESSERDRARAYNELLLHPWGTEVSIQKLRWLRAEMRKEVKK